MVERWSPYGIQLSCFMVLVALFEIRESVALNLEGLALLEFHGRIEDDPFGVFLNWNPSCSDPCLWMGVHCVDGRVQMLDLSGFSLQGSLVPGLRKLRYMRSLVLSNNSLSGYIPKEIGELKLLELLDLRHNNLSGAIPGEIGGMPSLKCLFLFGNNFQRGSPAEIEKLVQLTDSQCHQRLQNDIIAAKDCQHCSIGYCTLCRVFNQLRNWLDIKAMFTFGNSYAYSKEEICCHKLPTDEYKVSRRSLAETSNLIAAPAPAPAPAKDIEPSTDENIVVLSSGSFSATGPSPSPNVLGSPLSNQSPSSRQQPQDDSSYFIVYIMLGLAILIALIILTLLFFLFRHRRRSQRLRARDNNLLHRLSKAFVTGVPKLNASELQTACEDFSNIINTLRGCLMYKGILSSGVEIAVVSTTIRSSKQWTSNAESEYKKQVDVLSRINHKNFVNLLGFCKEEDPFVRMMVFEYTPNGNLYEHLHVDGFEHLDWHLRMRIVMGVSYCLEYVHHELTPPVIIPVHSDAVLLTDDYAAKLVHGSVWTDIASKAEMPDGSQSKQSDPDPIPDEKDCVYGFGVLLLEIISAKPPDATKDEGNLIKWASQYWHDKEKLGSLVDPSLKSFKMHDLEVICHVVKDCIERDPTQRPTMKEVTSKLRQATNISPEAATERISPLWWAELEILSDSS